MTGCLRSPSQMFTLAMLACVLVLLGACHKPGGKLTAGERGVIELPGSKPRGRAPSYDFIRDKYNQRVTAITQFKASAQIEIHYHDREGKRHYEQADQGRVIFIRPDHMVVLVRKFGVGDLFLAGCNEEAYWLFDLTRDEQRLLYQGKRDARGDAGRKELLPLPVPVEPRDLPVLMGLASLPEAGTVEPTRGGWLVSPTDASWRLVVDAQTLLPKRVDMIQAGGQQADDASLRVYITALLARAGQVETEGVPPGGWPDIMRRIELRPTDSKDTITVHLSAIDDGRYDNSISQSAFDLARLTRIYKPDEIIRLDEQPRE